MSATPLDPSISGRSDPAPSPVDPVPFDPTDVFSSTGPYAGPPETWQDHAASDDARQRALAFGPRHGELVRRLRQLGDANGGGLRGMAVGMMGRLEAQQLLTLQDRERLTALFDQLLAGIGLDHAAQQAMLAQVQAAHQATVNDPTAMPLALAVSAVAVDSVTGALATHDQAQADAYAAGVADTLGGLCGGWGGPVVTIAVMAAASSIAAGQPLILG